jgi:hypothetical protein
MLRSKKLRPFEVKILAGMALLLLAAAIIGMILGVKRGDWRILCASLGIGTLAGLYFLAARRGRPL